MSTASLLVGLAGMAVANGAVLLGARAIVRRIATGCPFLDASLFLLVRFVLISAVVLAAGTAGALTPALLGTAGLVSIAPLVVAGEHRFVQPRLLAGVPLALGLVIGLRLIAQVWFFAPYCGDVLGYHLPKVAEWVRTGGFSGELGAHTHATFPAGFELIETWWVLFLHHDVLVEMAGVEFLILSFTSTAALAMRLGLSSKGALLAATIYILAPGVQLQATSALNDGPVAALLITAIAFVAGRVSGALLAAVVGFGVGIKPTFAYPLPGLLLLAWLLRKEAPGLPKTGKTAVGLAALSVGVGAFWYVRNLVHYGNPVYPVGWDGLVDAQGRSWVQFGPSLHSLGTNLSALAGRCLTDWGSSWTPTLHRMSGWGPVLVFLGVPALVWGLVVDPRFRTLAIAYGVSLATILALVLADAWSARFVLFVPSLLGVALARAASRLPALGLLAAAGLLYQFVFTSLPAELEPATFRRLLASSWRDRTLADLHEARAEGDAVGYFGGNHGPAYLLYGPDMGRAVVYLRPGRPEDLPVEMDRFGLRRLYAFPGSAVQHRILEESLRRGWIRPAGGRFYIRS